ncbi:M16 family metallopeptidase [Clostridium perfringens]|uniref:Peptidase, M16 family n=1 Tax=Clostridium perfringens (strain SM101 / Type A) TaxID=289380 RepID=Q0SRQ7_CLOPS|nr:pitrilysin family protein [Clostridium perfringens]ABG86218.1 peptidase, M16 family [Clostridium perfringens SM101]MBP2861831.1 insulinase family protein [Clostridium perfringens]MDH5060168.1 Protease 3 precursor [Clostridium perfringens NCTC 8239]CAG9349043.1 M16 family peptidase [Clostridium perfringens NCTC 8239]SQB42852.1 M16 family peptidase [Clostridium perfringens]
MKRWTFDENTIILPNGLKVITIKKNTRLASINIGVNIGSLYEDEKELGMSHFVEHMLFKGTKNRSNEQLNRELEFLGGDYNAYTDYISTVYSITCLDEEFEKGIELLSDMILNSSFDEKEMKKEKGVVLSEIKSDKDDIEDLSISRIHEYAFDKSALRNSIAGTEEHVKGFKRKQVYDFYKKYYTPDNCVIVTVSAFSHEQMQKIITDLFGKWEGKSHKKAKIIKEENKNIVKTTYKSQIEQGTVTYLYAFKEVCEKDKLPLKILSYKLAESSNSILFRELREERGLAYDVYSQMDLDENVNTMNIFTSVREESIDEVIEVIDKAILDIKNRDINFDEDMLCMMKKTHKTGVVSTLEDCSSLCSYVLVQSLAGKDITEFINSMEELETLTGEDIYRVCNKYLNKPTIHILKPME